MPVGRAFQGLAGLFQGPEASLISRRDLEGPPYNG